MDFRHIIEKVLSFKRIFLTVFLFSLFVGMIVYFFLDDSYVASSKILVAKNFSKDNLLFSISDSNIDKQDFMQKQINFIKSNVVLNETIKELDLRTKNGLLITPNDLSQKIVIKPLWETDAIEIIVFSSRKGEAESIANSIARQYVKLIQKFKKDENDTLIQYLSNELKNIKTAQAKVEDIAKNLKRTNPKSKLSNELKEKAFKNASVMVEREKIKAEIKKITLSFLFDTKEEKLNQLNNQLSLLNSALNKYNEEINQLPPLDKKLYLVERDIKAYNSLIFLFEQKLNDIKLSQALNTSPVQVISYASTAKRLIRFKSFIGIIVILLLSLFIATISIFIADYFDQTIRGAEDLTPDLNLKFLGLTLRLTLSKKRKNNFLSIGQADAIQKTFETLYPLFDQTNFSQLKEKNKVIGFVSMLNHIEKSFICSSFASFLSSKKNVRVLLIDGDAKNQLLNDIFIDNKNEGLIEVLLGQKLYLDVIRQINEKLDVLFFGNFIKYEQNPNLISKKNLQLFIDSISKKYDLIIFDCPFLETNNPDLLETLSICDGIILVIPNEKLTKKTLIDKLSTISHLKNKIIGAILSQIKIE